MLLWKIASQLWSKRWHGNPLREMPDPRHGRFGLKKVPLREWDSSLVRSPGREGYELQQVQNFWDGFAIKKVLLWKSAAIIRSSRRPSDPLRTMPDPRTGGCQVQEVLMRPYAAELRSPGWQSYPLLQVQNPRLSRCKIQEVRVRKIPQLRTARRKANALCAVPD